MTQKTESPTADLAAIKALLDDALAPMRDEITSLKAKLAETDRMIPKFVPMQNRRNPSGMPQTPSEHAATLGKLRSGETSDGVLRSIPLTQNGKRLDQGALAAMVEAFQPRFQLGDAVRINPEAERLGWAPGRTWAELLATDSKNPEGYGVIREVAPFSHRGWMYRAKVEGHTPERGMIFDEHELLGA
jgi:hypothetical protein